MSAIEHATMIHRWEDLAFLHWPIEASDVRAILPEELEIDTFEGSGWIGILPFECSIRLPGTPFAPWLSTFHEVNVRTYVIGPEGPGIWFLSLDAARLGAVMMARRGAYRLPYMWAKMRTRRTPTTIRYESQRRWPSPSGPRCRIELEIGSERALNDKTDREHFLMERYRLYSPDPGHPDAASGIATAVVEHPPWTLREVKLLHLEQSLIEAAGLPAPIGPPYASFSDGVETRFGSRQVLKSAKRDRQLSPARWP